MKKILVSISLFMVFVLAWINFNACSGNISSTKRIDSTKQTVALGTSEELFKNYCAGCHGEQMQAFVDRQWLHGNQKQDIIKSIKGGYPDNGMPTFGNVFSDQQMEALADYILTGIENVKKYQFEESVALPDTFVTEELSFKLETVVKKPELESVWGMTFLPSGDMLFTEKNGTLYRLTKAGDLQKIEGTPEVVSRGQGGLLDIELHPQYATNGWLYLSYSISKGSGDDALATTAIMRGKLDGNKLVQKELIFEALPYSKTRHHYGSRLEFDKEGYLYFSVGDRGNHDENPQNLDNHCGKVHRIYDDGKIPKDNPFVAKEGALPSIYSYGHRNPQGMVIHPVTGKIWTHEHGPRGGDEINIIQKAVNYGWPAISYGLNYDGTVLTNKTKADGMQQPLWYWVPSIAPCGMTFVKGNRYKGWEGDLLVGSLRFKYVNRCKIENNKVVKQEMLLKNIGRVRSVEMSPDGYIYVSTEQSGAIYKLIPIEKK
jgi:aldose sugar dehydrogenase